MTKRKLIEALEALECSDDTIVVVNSAEVSGVDSLNSLEQVTIALEANTFYKGQHEIVYGSFDEEQYKNLKQVEAIRLC